MMNYLNKINFKDKAVNNAVDNDNEKFITGKNVNEIKSVVNSAIERSNLQDVYIDNIQEMLSYMLTLKIFQDQYPSKEELASYIALTNKSIDDVKTMVSKGLKEELEKFIKQTQTSIIDLHDRIKSVKTNNENHDTVLESLPESFSKIDKDITNILSNITLLHDSNTNILNEITKVKREDIAQNSLINRHYDEFTGLREVVEENIEKIKNLQSLSNTINSKKLNQLFLDNTNILYYLDQCRERLYLQDVRHDHLERMIKGIEDHEDWNDWNRLFSLLNLLKLKISRLSLVRHTQMKDVFFNDEELADFKHILNEIELKLKNFPDDELEEIDINREEIHKIMNNIDYERSLDPGVFEFYPKYPDYPENND